MTRFALLIAALAAASCSTTHTTGDCSGTAPSCYGGWSGDPECCIDFPRPATCEDGAWSCGREFLAEECSRIDPYCEGIDGGAPPPPEPTYFSCAVPSDCTLASNTCCGTCGRPSLADFDAINASLTEEYYLLVVCPEARTEPVPCPECAVAPNPNLQATCDLGRCEGIDVETDPDLSACATDADCVVRVPDCCECGADTSPYNLIALSTSGLSEYLTSVCDPDTGCDGCLPTYPAEAEALCISGACRVVVGAP